MERLLEAAFEEDDPALIAAALGDVARARGMTQMAKDTGISREALYRALSKDGRPEFNTILKVMKAFGLRLSRFRSHPLGPSGSPWMPKASSRRSG